MIFDGNSPSAPRARAYTEAMQPDVRVDASGTFCPVPILEIAKAVRPLAPGTLVELVATDPGVAQDLPAWCDATGHHLVRLEQREALWVAWVRKAEPAR
jgi:tRNA 2-thiouridine synthesizing protein A